MVIILVVGFTFLFDKTMEKQLMEYGQMTLNSNILYVDTLSKSTKDLLDSLSLDADVSKLLNHNSLSASELLTGLRRLAKYESSNYFVDSIYMYNRESNTIYASSPHMPEAAYSPDDFLDLEGKSLLEEYSRISNMEPIFRVYNSLYPTISEIHYISFLRYNALTEKNQSNVIMVNIRQDILSQLIKNTPGTHGSILLISDTTGKNWLISGDKENYSDSTIDNVIERIEKENGNFVLTSDGRKYIVCHSKVLNDNATLILIADESYIASATNAKEYGATIILLGILFGFCLILSIIALKHIWKAIQEQIRNAEINEKKKKELEESERRNRILSFLHSESNPDGIFFDENDKTLLMLIIDTIDEDEHDREINELLCKKAISIFKEYNPIATYENDGKCILIISGTIDNAILSNAKNTIEEELDITITIFASKAERISSLPEFYDAMSKSLPYRFLFGKGRIITMPMIEEHEMTNSSIPDEMISNLTTSILRLNIPESELIMNKIVSILSSGSYRSAQLCLVKISIAIDDAICRLQINNGIEKTAIAGSLIYQFQRLEYIDEITSVVKEILIKTEKSITQSKTNRQSEIVSEIVRITHEHCSERDFSINTVSDEIGMTPAYLGKIFKKTIGISFSRFVLNMRMEYACKLLAETDTPIEEVVYTVGFSDTPYFYKLFKESNGCTPMKYREEHTSRNQ